MNFSLIRPSKFRKIILGILENINNRASIIFQNVLYRTQLFFKHYRSSYKSRQYASLTKESFGNSSKYTSFCENIWATRSVILESNK